MPRGTGMSPTRRRNRRPQTTSPEALAARLPDDCRSFDGYDTAADFHRTAARVAAWIQRELYPGASGTPSPSGLDTQAPGRSAELTHGVMQAAGLTVTTWYRTVFAEQAAENRKALAGKDDR